VKPLGVILQTTFKIDCHCLINIDERCDDRSKASRPQIPVHPGTHAPGKNYLATSNCSNHMGVTASFTKAGTSALTSSMHMLMLEIPNVFRITP
jgi:hypothetical protein